MSVTGFERDCCKDAILINTRSVRTKDCIHAFLTRDGLEHVMEYRARKNGTNAFRLYSEGVIYLHRRENDMYCSLKDVRALKVRRNLLDVDRFLDMMPFVKLVAFFASKGPDGFFDLTSECFDLLDEGADKIRVLANFAERIFVGLGFASDFESCPSCDRHFESDERLGYNIGMSSPVCRECADEFPVLLPGMRRYLSFVRNMGLREAVGVEIAQESIERVCAYQRRRLEHFGVKI